MLDVLMQSVRAGGSEADVAITTMMSDGQLTLRGIC